MKYIKIQKDNGGASHVFSLWPLVFVFTKSVSGTWSNKNLNVDEYGFVDFATINDEHAKTFMMFFGSLCFMVMWYKPQ